MIGAANVLRWDRIQGHWLGGNLDGDGFVAGLKSRGHELTGKRVLMVGAGGAGKAIAHAVACECPAEMGVRHRSMGRAQAFLDRVKYALQEAAGHNGVGCGAVFVERESEVEGKR